MKLSFTPEEDRFRESAAQWLSAALNGPFADIRGCTSLIAAPQRRREWEGYLGRAGWSCIGWPRDYGGRDATLAEQVIFAEEYARAGGPPRLNHMGVELIGPTLIARGTEQQRARFLPEIAAGREIWCQGFSEPNAGSDLAGIQTRARLDGSQWVIDGQKVWTSLAQFADWIFLLCRTDERCSGRAGLSLLLVPMRQDGVLVRPIRQITGDAEFNEIFLDGARTDAANLVGAPGEGWAAAMTLLGFERGLSTLGQQMGFRNELNAVIAAARASGATLQPDIRRRLARAEVGLRVMRYSALRMLKDSSDAANPATLTYKIQWSNWRRSLGELAMDILGQAGEVAPGPDYIFPPLAHLYLFSRADTIYGGTNEIQRNIIAERGLGLPRDPLRR